MPTYVCRAAGGTLTGPHRAELARRFTVVHAEATGAPASFVQVLFDDIAPDTHYIGGRPGPTGGVHLHGHIREGRTAAAKDRLVRGLRDAIVAVTGLPGDLVWVYVSEIPPEQMIEFGRVLPTPGGEEQWMAELPDHLRARLKELDAL